MSDGTGFSIVQSSAKRRSVAYNDTAHKRKLNPILIWIGMIQKGLILFLESGITGWMLYQTTSCRSFLSDELARRLSANSRYSQRAFAKLLKMSPGELSEILRGKRILSTKSVLKVSQALNLSSSESKRLFQLAQKDQLPEGAFPRLPAKNLSEPVFSKIQAWYYLALLTLSECEGFKWNVSWLSKRLGISVIETRHAIEQLVGIGLLEKKASSYKVNTSFFTLNPELPSEFVREFHRQILKKAIQSLETDSYKDREMNGVGIAVDPKYLPEMKKDISHFLEEFSLKYGASKNKKEVFHCEIALFKLSKELKNA